MKLTGIADEAGETVDAQIDATNALGWKHIEARFVKVDGFEKGSIHEIPEEAFKIATHKFKEAGIGICGIGSTIGNWAHSINDPFEITEGEVSRCITRMKLLNSKIVRIMSYAILENELENDEPEQFLEERVKRLNKIISCFQNEGIIPVHENCMNYGGMSIKHALELQREIPEMKWVFDTGNPVFNPDRSVPKPYPRQSAWDFYQALKPYISHVHIKDGIWNNESKKCTFTMPGEGHGDVEQVLTDLKLNGYEGYISIEPHIEAVFHENSSEEINLAEKAKRQFESYVEYGKKLESMIAGID
jgi:sugar phosphate isomerase/epimerase